jgi:hypothetical protein
MENNFEKNIDERKKQEYLKERKNKNLQILQNRIHELEIDKQKRERDFNKERQN